MRVWINTPPSCCRGGAKNTLVSVCSDKNTRNLNSTVYLATNIHKLHHHHHHRDVAYFDSLTDAEKSTKLLRANPPQLGVEPATRRQPTAVTNVHVGQSRDASPPPLVLVCSSARQSSTRSIHDPERLERTGLLLKGEAGPAGAPPCWSAAGRPAAGVALLPPV